MSHLDPAADILLQHWGHDPKKVRKLAQLHRGLHWDRLLTKARLWANEKSILEDCLTQLVAYDEGKPPDEAALNEIIRRVAERIAVVQHGRPRGA